MKNLNFSQIKIFIKLEIIGEEYKNKNIYIYIYFFINKKKIAIFTWSNIICGAIEFVTLAHFTLGPKARAEENYWRGCIVKVQERPKDMAEDDLMLGTP